MKTIKYLILAGLFASSCSSPVYVQKDDAVDLSNYKTYMWVKTQQQETDQPAKATNYDISVHNAVNDELRKEGWREVSSDPDVLVTYDVLVERADEQRTEPVYSQPFTRLYYNPYRRRWGTIYYPSQFLGYQSYNEPVKEGTITITMVDAKTDNNIWQGWTTETLNYSRITGEEISKSVRNIFRKFDVAMR